MQTQEPICTHLCAFMKIFAAVSAHTRWLWLLCQGQYEVKSTFKFIFIFTSGKNHFHEMNGDVGMAGWK